ncbi:NAD(P)/FAD-dependent oxidoreductase [Nocardia sp. NPDC049526]|uniref:NAD(P)/FAD-dependent oxidoreductase n=1 Tax=Nocardia sp. NPDC049526 TaxID=3364316 RepID=UPI00379DED31
MPQRSDVVIVGARCAGSPLAALLAEAGLRVTVLEKAPVLRTTLSGHMMQTDSLTFLDRLGVTERVRATGAPYLTRVDTRMDEFRAVLDFPLERGDVGGGACVRREALDPILADAAVRAGADLQMGTRAIDLIRVDGRVVGVRAERDGRETEFHADLVVGADGRRSTVARLVGSRQYNVVPNERSYYWTYFEGAQWSVPTFVFHRWADRHVYAAPADHGLYIVSVSPEIGEVDRFRRDPEGMLRAHVASCDPVAEVLAHARRADKMYGFTRFDGYFREPAGPGWALIGDAGHFKDPGVGRGMGDAFYQARTLAATITAHLGRGPAKLDRAVAAWGRKRDRVYSDYYWIAADIACAGPVPELFPQVLQELSRRGRIDRYLEVFSHRRSPTQLMLSPTLAAAIARLISNSTQRRTAVVGDIARLLEQELRRRVRARNPIFADEPEPISPGVRTA